MSDDTIALVAQKPDLETVTHVLEHAAPGMWLHPHPDTSLLELREEQGPLLATVEPGLPLASRQEIGPIPGTPFGPPEHRSVWYPALGDVDDPRPALKALQAQWEHLASHTGQRSSGGER